MDLCPLVLAQFATCSLFSLVFVVVFSVCFGCLCVGLGLAEVVMVMVMVMVMVASQYFDVHI